MRSLEMSALAIFNWVLGPQPEEWLVWLHQLKRRETSTVHAIGSEREYRMVNGMAKKPTQVFDELISEVNGYDEFDPILSAVTSCQSLLLDDLDVGIGNRDVTPQEIHPRPEVHWHTRTVSFPEARAQLGELFDRNATSSRPHSIHREFFPRLADAPAVWDFSTKALDSPQLPSKPRPSYEAVQRPPVGPVPPAPTCHQQHQHQRLLDNVPYASTSALPVDFHPHHRRYNAPYEVYEVGNQLALRDSGRVARDFKSDSDEAAAAVCGVPATRVPFLPLESDRSWYDTTRFPRSIADGHHAGRPWGAFAGMLRAM